MPKSATPRATRCTCWHPILPAFSARLIVALRTLIGISCVAAFTLTPRTSFSIKGQLLLGVSFIVAIKSTLGATIQAAFRLYLGGAIATVYCLFVINVCPRDVYFAVGATNVLVLVIVYTDLPVTVRRFSIVPTCIILLQWFTKSYINTRFVLEIWASLSIGSTLAVLVTCIPAPLVATAGRELTMRMRFIARQARREITAIILLISEFHNTRLNEGYAHEINAYHKKMSITSDNGIEIPSKTYRDDDAFHHSTSFDDLRDDHLLEGDIQDLHSIVNDEMKQMQRALTEISYEPYFVLLKFVNVVRRFLRRVPFIKKFINPPSTLPERLAIWTTGLASIQRTITAMLLLDDHHHAFVGQRQLINAICRLLDSTFDFLDSTLPYTTASSTYVSTAHIVACRERVEEALEEFFETYTQVRENPRHTAMSNTDAIQLNTFLLLVLRLVHATITAAESSETPGARLETGPASAPAAPKRKAPFDWKKPFFDFAAYVGLRPSFGKVVRAVKTCLSVLVSAVVVITCRDRLQAMGWLYWAPMTTALVSDSSEGSTLRLSFHRLMAVLLGSTYAYVVVSVAQNRIAVAICICIFVALMGYLKTDPRKEYFASVCGQSASIITFLSGINQGQMSPSNSAVLARTSLTFLGIFIHVIISNLLLPITARATIKKRVSLMMKNVSNALKSSTDDFCSFVGPTIVVDAKSGSSSKPAFNLVKTLGETERIADGFPALLEEALNEPNFWKRPFAQMKDRYGEVAKSLRRISVDIRFVHRCTTILKAESKLHFAQEAKWQVRRASVAAASNSTEPRTARSWTFKELRTDQKLQNDLDIPLTIFMSYSPNSTPKFEHKTLISNNSSVSLRLAHTVLYQPVLEHIRTLEKHIQHVLSLTAQLIEKKAAVTVGPYEFDQLRADDAQDEQEITSLKTKRTLNRGPSFFAVPEFEAMPVLNNHYRFFSCFGGGRKTGGVNHDDDGQIPSLRDAVNAMLGSLVQFLYANDRFIRTEFVANQSIGDVLAFHTLSYAVKDMVEATTNLAKSVRRIKHIDTRTLIRAEREERLPPAHHAV